MKNLQEHRGRDIQSAIGAPSDALQAHSPLPPQTPPSSRCPHVCVVQCEAIRVNVKAPGGPTSIKGLFLQGRRLKLPKTPQPPHPTPKELARPLLGR